MSLTLLRKKQPTLGRVSSRIELSYRLVDDDGNALGPPKADDWSEIAGILKRAYPTLRPRVVELSAPYLIVRFPELPPSPWPFTLGGLPVRFSDSAHGGLFNPGVVGRGQKVLQNINLRRGDKLSDPVFKEALAFFEAQKIKVYEIFCFDNYWSIVIPDGTDLNSVPMVLAGQACCYRSKSKIPDYNHAALRTKIPKGVDFDDTDYATTPNALLRPGIMVSSSVYTATDTDDRELIDTFKKTTSGILVVNKDGEPFITVSTHGFKADGLVYHPNPIKGSVIGRIVEHLPGTDISVAKLNSGLRYTNHTFRSEMKQDGIETSSMSPCFPPHLRRYDSLSMDNPYTGFAEGTVIAVGFKLAEEGETDFVLHTWNFFENGSEPVDGSCGSPILNKDGMVVGLFRFKMGGDQGCLAVSATELQRFGYEICGVEQQF